MEIFQHVHNQQVKMHFLKCLFTYLQTRVFCTTCNTCAITVKCNIFNEKKKDILLACAMNKLLQQSFRFVVRLLANLFTAKEYGEIQFI